MTDRDDSPRATRGPTLREINHSILEEEAARRLGRPLTADEKKRVHRRPKPFDPSALQGDGSAARRARRALCQACGLAEPDASHWAWHTFRPAATEALRKEYFDVLECEGGWVIQSSRVVRHNLIHVHLTVQQTLVAQAAWNDPLHRDEVFARHSTDARCRIDEALSVFARDKSRRGLSAFMRTMRTVRLGLQRADRGEDPWATERRFSPALTRIVSGGLPTLGRRR